MTSKPSSIEPNIWLVSRIECRERPLNNGVKEVRLLAMGRSMLQEGISNEGYEEICPVFSVCKSAAKRRLPEAKGRQNE